MRTYRCAFCWTLYNAANVVLRACVLAWAGFFLRFFAARAVGRFTRILSGHYSPRAYTCCPLRCWRAFCARGTRCS